MLYKTNLKKRIIATLLDYVLFSLCALVYINLVGYNNNEGGKTVEGLLFLPIPLFWLLYFVIIESYWGGTISHQALNLKVLTGNRTEISLSHSFKRHMLDPIDFLFYGVPAIITINKTEKHQRIGDLFANTIVVDIKDSEQYNN